MEKVEERGVNKSRNFLTHSLSVIEANIQNLLFLGLTAILTGYFLVWLPGPGVGLQLIGIEIGEWIKFLGVGLGRDWFYLPPIVIGLTLGLLAAKWPNDRLQTWLARGLAVAVALLAFPAIASIQLEPPIQWLFRLVMIGLVIIMTVVGVLIAGQDGSDPPWIWLAMAAIALLGAILSTVEYIVVKPVVEEITNRPIGIGPGVWLNIGGSLLVASAAIAQSYLTRRAT